VLFWVDILVTYTYTFGLTYGLTVFLTDWQSNNARLS